MLPIGFWVDEIQVFGKMVIRKWVLVREESEVCFLCFLIEMMKEKVRWVFGV